ncbi:MAG TPA: hypothetical protein VM223_00215 [Planctomycetota bacterium]|nr:hypothetical protein [Planctomycetota bacterium]
MSDTCPQCGEYMRNGHHVTYIGVGGARETHGGIGSDYCLRRQLDAEKAKVKTLRGACQRAQTWLAAFAFNGYGVLCQDDVADHNPIQRELAAALAETETQP